MNGNKLTGSEAVDYAEAHGLTLNKYADPTESAREGLSADEARRIAKEDPSLIWIDVITGETITDEQIRELRARAHGSHFTNRNDALIELCDLARGWVPSDAVSVRAARARCAEILNTKILNAKKGA